MTQRRIELYQCLRSTSITSHRHCAQPWQLLSAAQSFRITDAAQLGQPCLTPPCFQRTFIDRARNNSLYSLEWRVIKHPAVISLPKKHRGTRECMLSGEEEQDFQVSHFETPRKPCTWLTSTQYPARSLPDPAPEGCVDAGPTSSPPSGIIPDRTGRRRRRPCKTG